MSSQKTDAIRFCVSACQSVCVCAVGTVHVCDIHLDVTFNSGITVYCVIDQLPLPPSKWPAERLNLKQIAKRMSTRDRVRLHIRGENNRKLLLLFYINGQQHELIETGGQVISTYATLMQCDTLAQFARRSHRFLLFDFAYGMCRMQRRLIFYLFLYLNSAGIAHSELFNI